MRISLFCFLILSALHIPRALAQDPKFAPPRPPALDGEIFDDDEDFDLPDDFRAGLPPRGSAIPPGGAIRGGGAPPGMTPNGGYAPPMIEPSGGFGAPAPAPYSQGTTTSAKKFRFKIVEGEFWTKGKKRTRGAPTHVSSSGGGGSDSPPAGF